MQDPWPGLRDQIEALIQQVAGQDTQLERTLRRKLENWAIGAGSGRVMGTKAGLRPIVYERQKGLAPCHFPTRVGRWIGCLLSFTTNLTKAIVWTTFGQYTLIATLVVRTPLVGDPTLGTFQLEP
jgi:hypothetical protein